MKHHMIKTAYRLSESQTKDFRPPVAPFSSQISILELKLLRNSYTDIMTLAVILPGWKSRKPSQPKVENLRPYEKKGVAIRARLLPNFGWLLVEIYSINRLQCLCQFSCFYDDLSKWIKILE
jgi:hypothetical protein